MKIIEIGSRSKYACTKNKIHQWIKNPNMQTLIQECTQAHASRQATQKVLPPVLPLDELILLPQSGSSVSSARIPWKIAATLQQNSKHKSKINTTLVTLLLQWLGSTRSAATNCYELLYLRTSNLLKNGRLELSLATASTHTPKVLSNAATRVSLCPLI